MEKIGCCISIPKNGSKSILEILNLGANRDLEDTNSPIIWENHQRGEVLKQRYDLSNIYTFCFSRNPYSRVKSWYTHHRRFSISPYNQMSFEEWVKAKMPHHWKKQNLTNYEELGITPLLQYNFVKNTKVDYIGKMENFDRDMLRIITTLNAICEKKKIKIIFTYNPIKKNRTNSQKLQYTQEMKDIVYNELKKDFEYFDYPRDY